MYNIDKHTHTHTDAHTRRHTHTDAHTDNQAQSKPGLLRYLPVCNADKIRSIQASDNTIAKISVIQIPKSVTQL